MKFYLDGTQITDEPDGDIITSIRRDKAIGGVIITNDAQLRWHGDGYEYIQSVIDSSGFCGEIECQITDDCNGQEITIFDGKIFILEIKKDSNCIITAPLQDNSYYARINKNKSIESFVDTVKSKNNVDIDAAPVNRITMFNPQNGTNKTTTYVSAYRVYDIFANMVAFMSDGEVAFDSNLFGIGGEFEGLSVAFGLEIAFPSGNNPVQDSFDHFFTEVRKKTNCTFYVDSTTDPPTFRVEKYTDLYNSTVNKKLDDIDEVEFKVDTKSLYAIVSVGSQIVEDAASGPGIYFPEENDYITYKKEDYTLLEQCNIDVQLDLVSDYIISSNAIGELVMTPTDKWEDELFFIDTDTLVDNTTYYTSVAKKGDPFGSGPPFFYNSELTNDKVLERWKGRLASDALAVYQGSKDNRFRASLTTIKTTFPTPFQFDNDYTSPNFDGATQCGAATGNYGDTTPQCTAVPQTDSFYTCPADGTYTFFTQFRIQSFPNANSVQIIFQRLNAGGTILQQFSSGAIAVPITPSPTLFTASHQASFYCDNTNIVQVWLYTATGGLNMSIWPDNGNTYFACTSAPESRSIVLELNKDAVPIIMADMDYPITNSDFYDIQDSPFKQLSFTYSGGNVKSGWINSMKYNHRTSIANISLIGTQLMLA